MSEKVDTGAEVPDVQFPRSGGQKAVLWLDVSQTAVSYTHLTLPTILLV